MTDDGKLATPRAGTRPACHLSSVASALCRWPSKLAGAYLRRRPRTTLAEYLHELALPDLRGEGIDASLEITRRALTDAERATCDACAAMGFTVASVARAIPARGRKPLG